MIKVAGIDHIVLRTTKLDEMVNFYSEVLGCKVVRQLLPETGLTQLSAGNALIDLVTVDSELGRIGGGPPTKTENNLDHFCLQIKAISEADIKKHLSLNGVSFGAFINRYGAQGFGHSVYIQDPEGNKVELKVQK